jgi:hypothetical protein
VERFSIIEFLKGVDSGGIPVILSGYMDSKIWALKLLPYHYGRVYSW